MNRSVPCKWNGVKRQWDNAWISYLKSQQQKSNMYSYRQHTSSSRVSPCTSHSQHASTHPGWGTSRRVTVLPQSLGSLRGLPWMTRYVGVCSKRTFVFQELNKDHWFHTGQQATIKISVTKSPYQLLPA